MKEEGLDFTKTALEQAEAMDYFRRCYLFGVSLAVIINKAVVTREIGIGGETLVIRVPLGEKEDDNDK